MATPKILVIDDQPYIRDILTEELSHEGYQVEGIGDAQSIWKHLKESPPDLVILDLYLKGFEGWDVLREIKMKDPSLPVLILTAYDSFAEDPRLSEADGYFIKSLNAFDGLKDKIADVLG